MKAVSRIRVVSIGMVLGSLILGVSAYANSIISPEWSSLRKMGSHQSSLDRVPIHNSIQSGNWIDTGPVQGFQNRYSDLMHRYDQRSNAGLVNFQDQINYQHQMEQLSQDYVRQAQSTQVDLYSKRMKNHVETNQTFESVAAPVGAMVFAAGVSTGRVPLRLRIPQVALLSARTNFLRNQGEFKMQCSLFDTSYLYDGRANAQAVTDLSQPLPAGERGKLKVSRGEPVLGFRPDLTYGMSSRLLNAQVSRPLFLNISAAVGSTMSTTASGASEQTLRLSYGLQF